ncbi:MAG: DUF2867 domain-containing protein, partial [Acidimicrobiales bacterium]
PDYQDRFIIETTPGQYASVDQVATDWFTKQPGWIRLLSTNTRSSASIESAIVDGGFQVGTSVGSWKVVARNEDEIVFGERMGFMEYCYSLALRADEPVTIEGSTVVTYLWRRTGRFYFALVRPMHRRFIRFLLAKTVA